MSGSGSRSGETGVCDSERANKGEGDGGASGAGDNESNDPDSGGDRDNELMGEKADPENSPLRIIHMLGHGRHTLALLAIGALDHEDVELINSTQVQRLVNEMTGEHLGKRAVLNSMKKLVDHDLVDKRDGPGPSDDWRLSTRGEEVYEGLYGLGRIQKGAVREFLK